MHFRFLAISGLSGAEFQKENEKLSNLKFGQDGRAQTKLDESMYDQGRMKKANSSIQSGIIRLFYDPFFYHITKKNQPKYIYYMLMYIK